VLELDGHPEEPGSPVCRRSLDLVGERLQGFPSLREVKIDLVMMPGGTTGTSGASWTWTRIGNKKKSKNNQDRRRSMASLLATAC